MGFREKDGEEFDEVQVALIPIIEDHVPNEFVVRGHVVVGDHAAIPPGPELHSDVSSDEVMGATREPGKGGAVENGVGGRWGGGSKVGGGKPCGRDGRETEAGGTPAVLAGVVRG